MENLEKEPSKSAFLENWYHNYHKLVAYLKNNKDEHFIKSEEIDHDLIKWINIQAKIKNKLSPELRNKLAELNFDFYEIGNVWEKMYHQLASFAKKNRHINVPDHDPKFDSLKDWLLRQILNKKYLTDSQISRLDLLGVDWEMVFTRDQRWEQMYIKLQEFYQRFGHCQVPHKWEPDKSLANWVRVQRRMRVLNKLQPERENKLNELNFIWHIQTVYDSHWQHFYNELKSFYQANGHCRVPGKFKQLTSWIENQRTFKKNSLLLPEREKQLNEIGFIWNFKNIKKSYWEEKLKELKAFKAKNGHSFVPVNYKENKALGTWVATQRKLESKNQLEEKKKKKLSQLGFVWSTDTQQQLKSNYDSQWALNYERLKIYKQVYGTCQVSVKLNPVLQRWTRWQRLLFYQGKLAKDRINKLNEIRFPWNVQEGYWMKMYEALADFKTQNGHTHVPYNWEPNKQLAAWVYRTKLTKAELSAQKIELLNMLGFDWHFSRKNVVSWEGMFQRAGKI